MNDDQTTINPSDVQAGPSISDVTAQGDGAGAASDGAGAGEGDAEKVTHHRVRIEHADGSRSWLVEQTDDADTALRLAAGRAMGTALRAEPLNADGTPRKDDDA